MVIEYNPGSDKTTAYYVNQVNAMLRSPGITVLDSKRFEPTLTLALATE